MILIVIILFVIVSILSVVISTVANKQKEGKNAFRSNGSGNMELYRNADIVSASLYWTELNESSEPRAICMSESAKSILDNPISLKSNLFSIEGCCIAMDNPRKVVLYAENTPAVSGDIIRKIKKNKGYINACFNLNFISPTADIALVSADDFAEAAACDKYLKGVKLIDGRNTAVFDREFLFRIKGRFSNRSVKPAANQPQMPVTPLPSQPEPEYAMSNSQLSEVTAATFVPLCSAQPDQDFEIASYGFNALDGMPYKMNSRQKSYGFFLGSEDVFTPVSYKLLTEEWGTEINGDNWELFVDAKTRERIKELTASKPPIDASTVNCSPNSNRSVTRAYVHCKQRFGAHAQYFRKCEDGWRAFSIRNWETGANCIPLNSNSFPSEAEIKGLMRNCVRGFKCFDRLLSENEVNWFFNRLEEKNDNDGESWNDLYGSSTETAVVETNGKTQVYTNNLNYYHRIGKDIETLAENGIK